VRRRSRCINDFNEQNGDKANCKRRTSWVTINRESNFAVRCVWCEFNHGGNITQRQVAHLLDAVDIHPVPLHPTKRKDFARQGYKLEQFIDAFERLLPGHPIIQSSATASRTKRRKTKR
jgi:hypothetical protein